MKLNYPIHEHILSLIMNLFTLGFHFCVYRATHKSMVLNHSHCITFKKASFKDFKTKFDSIKWSKDPIYDDSYNSDDWPKNYFHADIICFDNVGYVLSSYGLVMAKKYARRKYPTHKNVAWVD